MIELYDGNLLIARLTEDEFKWDNDLQHDHICSGRHKECKISCEINGKYCYANIPEHLYDWHPTCNRCVRYTARGFLK